MDEVVHIRSTPCSYCGRNFSDEAIRRHENICSKTSQRTKKYVYDSSKVRSIQTDVPSYGNKSSFSSTFSSKHPTKPTSKREQPLPAKKSNWRQQHEDLVKSLRAARQVSQAIKSGKPLPPPLPPAENPDYITCDYCGRRFNESAAARHIEFCKGQHERLPKGRGNALAAQKQATRINYRPPALKSRKSSGYSDNSSPKLKSPSDAYHRPSQYEESNYGSGKSLKGNPSSSMANHRSPLVSKPGNFKHQSLSQSSSYLDSSSTNGYNAGESRMVGRGRGNKPSRYNDASNAAMGRMPSSSSYNSHLNDAKFCSECGCKFPSSTCKFCSECGSPKVY